MAQPKSSKQKRAAQNKASRQAQAARKANAHAEPGSTGGGAAKAAPKRRGGLRGLLNPTPPTKAAAGGGGGSAPARGAAARGLQPVGYRAAMSALFASVAAVVLCIVAVPVAVNSQGDLYTRESLAVTWSVSAARASVDAPDATPEEIVEAVDDIEDGWTPDRETKPALVALWPWSITAALPVLGTFFGFQAVRQRKPSKAVSRSLFLTVLGVLTTTQLAFLFLPSVIALAVAMYQVRKAEVAAASVAVGDPTTGAVVEAQVVDDLVEADVADADVADADGAEADVDDGTSEPDKP